MADAVDYEKAPWIHAVQGASMLDWPGRTAAVVFLSGCDFACAYCHNPELREALVGEVRLSEAVARLAERRGWVGSVVVTGGEPLVHPHLEDVLLSLRFAGFLTALNTNGSHPERLSWLLEGDLLDRVNLDLKAPLGEYGTRPGLPDAGSDVARSLALLQDRSSTVPDFDFECRTTLDRRYVRSAGEVGALARLLRPQDPPLVLQALQGDGLAEHAVSRSTAESWTESLPKEIRPELRGFRY